MAYKVIILYRLYMPSYFLGTFTEYPFFIFVQICELLIPRLNLFDLSSERELYFVSLSYVMTVKYAVYREGGLLISFIKNCLI